MAKGIYMGGEVLKGKASKEIRSLVSGIKKQQDKFAKQSGKFKLADLGGDALKRLAWLTKNPWLIGGAYGLDFLIDQFMPATAGDPEEIKKLQTAYTGGGYGEEFGEMIEEGEPSLLSSLAGQGLDFATGYIGSQAVDKLDLSGIGDWFSKFLGGGMEGTPVIDQGWQMAREGGYVSPKKYYGGGSVQGGTPTIAGYFSQQGKTLGGSNKQSLAEMLGRI